MIQCAIKVLLKTKQKFGGLSAIKLEQQPTSLIARKSWNILYKRGREPERKQTLPLGQ